MDQIRKDPITIVLKHGCSIAQRDQEGGVAAASFGSIKLGDIIISLITIGYADYLHTYYNVPKNAILPLNIQYRTVSVISTPLPAFLSFLLIYRAASHYSSLFLVRVKVTNISLFSV